MRCPDTAAFRLSPPLVARPLTCAWPFAVARATQVRRRNHNQSGTVWKAIALARSDHPTAMGEPEPSVALPRTPPPAIAWYQQEPILQRYPAIDATDTSVSRAWVHVGQPALNTALCNSTKSEPQGPLQTRGAPWVARHVARFQTAIARFGHESPRRLAIMPRHHDSAVFGTPFSR